MRIACVVTVCAALISTLLNAESTRYKRRPQSKEQLFKPNSTNDKKPSEITFTTLRPNVPSHNQNAPPSVYLASNKRLIRIRQGPTSPMIQRGPNGFAGSRRRRQLQHPSVKTSHLSRSFELADNQIENQKIEIVQPTGAFEKGAIRIEPVYRVTKNKNVFDSIVDIVRRIIDPPRSVGPLVGPFHFPGIGDKVYIRLLEPVRPDHLVVRLISHLPAAEIETTLDKNVLTHDELLSHPEIPSIDHATIVLPKDALSSTYKHSDVHFISPDDTLSGNDMVQVSKTTSTLGPTIGQANGLYKNDQVLETYKLNLKSDELNGNHRVARHHKRAPVVRPTTNRNNQSRSNRTHGDQRLANNHFQDSFEQPYHFHSTANESSEEAFVPFSYQSSQYPRNISTSGETFYSRPINPFDAFLRSQITASAESQLSNSSAELHGDTPRYSIEFASRNMRYLNLDGSVEPVVKDRRGEEFLSGSSDREWKPLRGVTARVTSKEDHKVLQERSDYSNNDDDGFLEVELKSSDEVANYQRNGTSRSVVEIEKQGSGCCSRRGDENINVKMSSGGEMRNETTTANNSSSASGVISNLSSGSTMNRLPRLQSIRRNLNSTVPRKV